MSSSDEFSSSESDQEILAAAPAVRSASKRKICLPARLQESCIELEKPVLDLSSELKIISLLASVCRIL